MTAVLLALGAAVGWGCSDFLGGVMSRRLTVWAVLVVSLPAGLLVLGPIMIAHGEGPPSTLRLSYGVLAGVTGIAGLTFLYRGLARGAMGVVAPISATAPLIPLAVGLVRGERPSGLQLAGIALALTGVIAAGREFDPGRPGHLAAGVGMALLAAGSFGASLVLFDSASAGDPYWATLVVRLVGTVFAVAVLLTSRPHIPTAPRILLVLAAIGLLDATATTSFAVATTRGLLSVVAVLASLFPIVVVLLARVFLHERPARTQLAGAVTAVAGIALISAG
jgi:drug/metabolite transporter (DMT)-like permease